MDKRAWLLAFGGGNICGLISVALYQSHIRRLIESTPPLNLYGMEVSVDGVITVLLITVALLILPAIVSATARRFSLLWGVIPGLLLCLWTIGYDWITHHSEAMHDDIWAFVFVPVLSLLLICGPISLYRWTQRRKQERLLTLQQAMHDAANAAPPEGVWPPPPLFPRRSPLFPRRSPLFPRRSPPVSPCGPLRAPVVPLARPRESPVIPLSIPGESLSNPCHAPCMNPACGGYNHPQENLTPCRPAK